MARQESEEIEKKLKQHLPEWINQQVEGAIEQRRSRMEEVIKTKVDIDFDILEAYMKSKTQHSETSSKQETHSSSSTKSHKNTKRQNAKASTTQQATSSSKTAPQAKTNYFQHILNPIINERDNQLATIAAIIIYLAGFLAIGLSAGLAAVTAFIAGIIYRLLLHTMN